jgi:DNA-binding GntR family transcriptional regulator
MVLKSHLQIEVYDLLKDKILSGELTNNTLYSETKLAAEFGISRTPIREALYCLSQDGYIDIMPSKGFIIHQLNENDMRESIQIRCAIEGFCTHLIASEIESEKAQLLLSQLADNLECQKESSKSNLTLDDFMDYDHKFHLTLVNYADNKEFLQTFQRSMYQIHLTSKSCLSVPNRIEDTLREHIDFYEQLKAKDGETAYSTLINHLLMPLQMNILKNE